MDVLDVKTDNPSWTMDGMSLLPYIMGNNTMPRPTPLGIQWVRRREGEEEKEGERGGGERGNRSL